jgi:Raf kinase inhibitor-like YbhB/YbcL family protein
MKISSPAFKHDDMIPSEYTCDGSDISPPLIISEAPSETQSLAIIMDDPDAPMGTFTHWVVWNIPPQKTQFVKGEKISFPQGKTSFGSKYYGVPCPPSGTHRYFFKLYALDLVLNLKEGSSKGDLERAMSGHILAEASLMGKYSRK